MRKLGLQWVQPRCIQTYAEKVMATFELVVMIRSALVTPKSDQEVELLQCVGKLLDSRTIRLTRILEMFDRHSFDTC